MCTGQTLCSVWQQRLGREDEETEKGQQRAVCMQQLPGEACWSLVDKTQALHETRNGITHQSTAETVAAQRSSSSSSTHK